MRCTQYAHAARCTKISLVLVSKSIFTTPFIIGRRAKSAAKDFSVKASYLWWGDGWGSRNSRGGETTNSPSALPPAVPYRKPPCRALKYETKLPPSSSLNKDRGFASKCTGFAAESAWCHRDNHIVHVFLLYYRSKNHLTVEGCRSESHQTHLELNLGGRHR